MLGFVPFEFQTRSTVSDHYLYLPLLGLAIASELAERMSGRLTVVSVPGDTAFTLELPNDEDARGGPTPRPPSTPPVHQRV